MPLKRLHSQMDGDENGEDGQPLGVDNPNEDEENQPKKRNKVRNPFPVDDALKVARNNQRPNGGNLNLYFVGMGQGDCTILITPSGEAFLFDIGSSEGNTQFVADQRNNLLDLLSDNMIFGVNSNLKGMVITHSDEDHVNYCFLLKVISVVAERLYHTNTFLQYKKQVKTRSYKAQDHTSNIDSFLREINPNPLQVSFTSNAQTPPACPTFNSIYPKAVKGQHPPAVLPKDLKANNYPPVAPYQHTQVADTKQAPVAIPMQAGLPAAPANPFVPYWTPTLGFVIHDEIHGTKRTTIRMLVAGYRDYQDAYDLSKPSKEDYPKTNQGFRLEWQKLYDNLCANNNKSYRREGLDANQASAMIAIQYTDTSVIPNIAETYIISGDATEKTLNMVMRSYPDLQNVVILQMPHHGSEDNGSASESFIDRMNPKIAVYSAPYDSAKFGHPRASSVNAVETKMGAQAGIKSNYIFWTPALNDKGKVVYEYTVCTAEPYRIYVTGWMADGYYRYTPPYAVDTNIPAFRRKLGYFDPPQEMDDIDSDSDAD